MGSRVKVPLRFATAKRREAVDVGERHRDPEDGAVEAGLADEGLGLSQPSAPRTAWRTTRVSDITSQTSSTVGRPW